MCDTGHVKLSLEAIPRLLKTRLTIHIWPPKTHNTIQYTALILTLIKMNKDDQ